MSDYYYKKLTENLIKETGVPTFEEARLKWRVTGVKVNLPTQCLCTHPITENCMVQNVDDDRELIIGSCCIRQFFPEEQRAIMEAKLRALKRKTRDCVVCNRRYNKEGALHERMCNECSIWNTACEDCDELFQCHEKDRSWKLKCGECLHLATGKTLKGNHEPVDPRRKTRDCLGCGGRIPNNPNRPRCLKCYKRFRNNEGN
jgi:hypothetical protein